MKGEARFKVSGGQVRFDSDVSEMSVPEMLALASFMGLKASELTKVAIGRLGGTIIAEGTPTPRILSPHQV